MQWARTGKWQYVRITYSLPGRCLDFAWFPPPISHRPDFLPEEDLFTGLLPISGEGGHDVHASPPLDDFVDVFKRRLIHDSEEMSEIAC